MFLVVVASDQYENMVRFIEQHDGSDRAGTGRKELKLLQFGFSFKPKNPFARSIPSGKDFVHSMNFVRSSGFGNRTVVTMG